MSLLNESVEAHSDGCTSSSAPPLPGEGPIVYMQTAGPLLIVARRAPGELLCHIWSWFVGDDFWERNWIA